MCTGQRETERPTQRGEGGLIIVLWLKLSRFSTPRRVSHQVKESVCQSEAQLHAEETLLPRGGRGEATFVVALSASLCSDSSPRDGGAVLVGEGTRKTLIENKKTSQTPSGSKDLSGQTSGPRVRRAFVCLPFRSLSVCLS